jgi:hypothetical protein
MTDFFYRDAYVRNLEQGLTVDPFHSGMTFVDSLKGSNMTAQIATFSNTISQSLTATNGTVHNLVSDSVQTSAMTACNLTATSASLLNASMCNLNTVDLEAGVITAYSTATTLLSGSTCSLLNVPSYYVESPLMIGSNVQLTGQLYNESNAVLIATSGEYCGTIDYSNVLNVPVPGHSNLTNYLQDLFNLAQSAYDLYDILKSLLNPVNSLPKETTNSLSEALGSNDHGSSNIYVDWAKLQSRPISTINGSTDIGLKTDVYVSDLSQLFVIPQGQVSQNQGNLFNTKTGSNMFLDFTNRVAYLDKVQMYGASNLGLYLRSNCITAPTVLVNGLTVGSNSLNVLNVTASQVTASQMTTPVVSASNLQNYFTVSNGSNQAFPLVISSSCNVQILTQSNSYLQLSSSKLAITASSFLFQQTQSNLNPFGNQGYTSISTGTSNLVLQNVTNCNTTRFIQNYNSFKLRFATSNSSNVITRTITVVSNQTLTGLCNVLLNGDLQNTALYTACNSLIVSSNVYAQDFVSSDVFRGNLIQLNQSIPITSSFTPGVYGGSRLILDTYGNLYPQDAMNSLYLFRGCVKMPTINATAAYAGTYAKSVFLY